MPLSTERALLTLRTVRHLRPGQIAHRLRYRLRRPPRARTAPAPARRPLGAIEAPLAKATSIATFPIDGPSVRNDGSATRDDEVSFTFLGVTRRYPDGVRWLDPEVEKLWLYNLHYFDFLGSAAAMPGTASAESLVRDWIAANPHGTGDGWEPYPCSLRIVNWIKWLVASDAGSSTARDRSTTLDAGSSSEPGDPSAPSDEILDSLALQVRWLERNLEHHILANHLFANAKAMAFAGLFFGGEEGERWRRDGIALVDAELGEQILADGGHYERSPMYQATLLEDVLDLIALADAANAARGATGAPDVVDAAMLARWRETARAMLDWLGAMSHPDGEIAFFNDAAFGIAATVASLAGYAGRLGVVASPDEPSVGSPDEPRRARGSRWLEASGYARLVAGPATLLVDLAPVGPDHQPGHTHADTLSFELSLGRERVIVNSGTSTYRDSPERHRQRSTPAHNTVTVDGADSSEVWAGFRVARRAYPRDVACSIEGAAPHASAAHDGYRRLPGRVVHHRRCTLDARSLTIVDRLSGRRSEAFASVHFHPRLDVHADGRVTDGDALVARWTARGGEGRVERSTWHPRFGSSEPNHRLVVPFAGDEVTFTLAFDDTSLERPPSGGRSPGTSP